MTSEQIRTAETRTLGLVVLVGAFPAWWSVFRLVDHHADGHPVVPFVVAGVVFFGLLFTGLALLTSATGPDRWPAILRSAGWVLAVLGTVLGVGAFVVGSASSNESSGGAEALTVVAAFAIMVGAAVLFLGFVLIQVSRWLHRHRAGRLHQRIPVPKRRGDRGLDRRASWPSDR